MRSLHTAPTRRLNDDPWRWTHKFPFIERDSHVSIELSGRQLVKPQRLTTYHRLEKLA